MYAYVFANQKGGVGKTTIALGVAAALGTRGTGVLLIDLDLQASATWSRGRGLKRRPPGCEPGALARKCVSICRYFFACSP
jgi:cellulose biosynthesis protein BcsQ